MARRHLSAKQVAAGFGGKRSRSRQSRRSSSSRPSRRGKSKAPWSLAKMALPLYVLWPTLLGGQGYTGVLPALKAGNFQRAMLEAIDTPVKQLTGRALSYPGFDVKKPLEAATIYFGGRVANKLANKAGVNRLAAMPQKALAGRAFLVI